MDVKEFVAETIKQVISGVKEAQEYAASNGAHVVPEKAKRRRTHASNAHYEDRNKDVIQAIEFDIAITTKEDKEGKTGGGIFVAGIGLGGQTKDAIANQSISRMKFEIPIRLASQEQRNRKR